MSYIHTTSGRGSCRDGGRVVELSAPNNGTVVEAAHSREGSMDTKCTASVSPGSAPSMKNGPVCGFTNGHWMTLLTTSPGPRTWPPKASSVQSSTMSPGSTFMTGGTPPNVQENSSARGWYETTLTRSLLGAPPGTLCRYR